VSSRRGKPQHEVVEESDTLEHELLTD